MNLLSIEGFASKLKSDIESIVRGKIAHICEEALLDSIMNTVYAQQRSYRQTGDLISAVEVSNFKFSDGHVSFEVTMNPGALRPEYRPNELSAHLSFSGRPFTFDLLEVLEEGSPNNIIYQHPAHKYMEKTHKTLDERLIDDMRSALQAHGYEVT